MVKIKIKYHPVAAKQKYPSYVDIYKLRNGKEEYLFSEHIDSIGELFLTDEGMPQEMNKRYYELMKTKGEVIVTLDINE